MTYKFSISYAIEAAAMVISGAPFPSQASLRKARAAIAATGLLERVAELEAENERLREGLNAILDRGPERDHKWIGMSAKDIARVALKGQP